MKNFTSIIAGLALTAGCIYTANKLFTPSVTATPVTEEVRYANFVELTSYTPIDESEPNLLFDCVSETLHDYDNELEILEIAPDVTEILVGNHCSN